MAYWWVNQGQTHAEEWAGDYLWSPVRNRNGARNPYYDNMGRVESGDLVFHYVGKPLFVVGRLSMALSDGHPSEQPDELRRTGLWDDEGWRVDLVEVEPTVPVQRNEARAIDPGASPFQVDGNVKLGYLIGLETDFAVRLMSRMDAPARDVQESGGADPEPPSGPVGTPETVPLEVGRKLAYDQVVTAQRRAAARGEWQLVDRFVARLGLEGQRRRYRLETGGTLYCDLFLPDRDVLVEAKASAGRGAVREAIGQLYDYADKEDRPVRKVVLLPARPAEDLLAVVRSAGVVPVWEEDGGWVGLEEAGLV